MSDAPSSPLPGADNYRIGPEISTGGMGSVLEAHDGKLDRTVAVKVMLLDAHADARMRERFVREAQVLAQLAHPNIVPIYDLVWEDGLPLFYSMKLVKGRTLQAILTDLRNELPEARREYTLDRLLTVFRKVCDAIAFAHRQGVLHRDLKPANIMVGEFGEVLVMDWGLAKRRNDECGMTNDEPALSADSDPSFTLQGTVLGTPHYMSPEQAGGQLAEVDERSDIYALGGILYAILTLRPPVEGAKTLEVLEKVSRGEIPAPVACPALSSVAMKALQRAKTDRYPSVTSLSADVEAYQNGFATSSEQAGAFRQLELLMLRHQVVTASLAALLVMGCGFVWKVMASERVTRQSLATARIALADLAHKSSDITGLSQALHAVPGDLRDQTWRYLDSRRDASLGALSIPGFCEEVSDVCAVPQAPGQFTIASRDGRVGLVDVVQRQLLRVIDTGHPGELRLSISDDGSRLLSRSSSASEAALHELATGTKLRDFPVSRSEEAAHPYLQTLALNAAGTLAALADFDSATLHLIDTATGAVRWTKPFRPLRMIFHPGGQHLFLIQHQHYDLQKLSVADGTTMGRERLNAFPNSMALSPDAQTLIIGLISGELERIHGKTGARVIRRTVASMPVAQVAFSAGGNVITLGGSGSQAVAASRVLSLWHPVDLVPKGSFLGISDYAGYLPLSVNPSSGHLLTAQSPPQLWHLEDEPLAKLKPGGDGGWSCHFLSDTLLLTRERGFLARRDFADPRQPVTLEPAFAENHMVSAVHPPTGRIATAWSRNSITTPGPSLRLFQNRSTGVSETWSRPPESENDATLHLDFDTRGQRLLRTTPPPHGRIILHDVGTGEVLRELQHEAYKAVFAGRNEHIIAISGQFRADNTQQGGIVILDPQDGRVLASREHDSAFYALATSLDRRLIAVAGTDRSVMILDADTLAVRHRFRAHDAVITAACFHPTQPILATGSADHSLKLWNYPEARLLRTFTGTEGLPRSLIFSPDGRLLATDGRDSCLRVFAVGEP